MEGNRIPNQLRLEEGYKKGESISQEEWDKLKKKYYDSVFFKSDDSILSSEVINEKVDEFKMMTVPYLAIDEWDAKLKISNEYKEFLEAREGIMNNGKKETIMNIVGDTYGLKRIGWGKRLLEELNNDSKFKSNYGYGGRRTRGKLRARSRAKSRKKRRKSKGRKRRRKNLKKRTKRRR